MEQVSEDITSQGNEYYNGIPKLPQSEGCDEVTFSDGINDSPSNSRTKVFSKPFLNAKTRAWEHIRAETKCVKNGLEDVGLTKIADIKKNQNKGVNRFRKSRIYRTISSMDTEIDRPTDLEAETASSSKYCHSECYQTSEKVAKIFPSRVQNKIIKIFRKFYVNEFDKICKTQKVNFPRKVRTMPKEKFLDLIVS